MPRAAGDQDQLFCGCDNDSREAEPNTHVCEVCGGMPGSLPVLNKRALELALRLGLALNAGYEQNFICQRHRGAHSLFRRSKAPSLHDQF